MVLQGKSPHNLHCFVGCLLNFIVFELDYKFVCELCCLRSIVLLFELFVELFVEPKHE